MALEHITFRGKKKVWNKFVKKVKKNKKKIWDVMEHFILKYSRYEKVKNI